MPRKRPRGKERAISALCRRESIDGSCGCKRSMVGMVCHKATTTMKVVEVELAEEDLALLLSESLGDAGFDIPLEAVEEEVRSVIELCGHFPLNAVLERRGDDFIVRKK